MADRPATSAPPDDGTAILDGPIRLIAVLAVILVALMGVRLLGDASGNPGGVSLPGGAATGSDATTPASSSPGPSVDPASFLVAPTPAAALDLTGPNGLPVSLAAMRGTPVLVFFGYTHCPDVCPATIGKQPGGSGAWDSYVRGGSTPDAPHKRVLHLREDLASHDRSLLSRPARFSDCVRTVDCRRSG